MGAAQDQHRGGGVLGSLLQLFKINGIVAVIFYEGDDPIFPFVGLYGNGDGIVDGCKGDDPISGLCQGLDCKICGGHHARAHHHPVFFHLPAVSFFDPALEGAEEFLPALGGVVAVNAVLRPFFQGVNDFGRGQELHIGNPHGEGALGIKPREIYRIPLPFGAVEVGPVNALVKIVLHNTSSCLLYKRLLVSSDSLFTANQDQLFCILI